ncbi:MAG: hypothetical protein JW893_02460 [Candidatus Omnitrophica bacterium]|nr:hypothetical protein [Candidatus Omnitrophota bacterium]
MSRLKQYQHTLLFFALVTLVIYSLMRYFLGLLAQDVKWHDVHVQVQERQEESLRKGSV